MEEETYVEQLNRQTQELANLLRTTYTHAAILMATLQWKYRIGLTTRDLILCALTDIVKQWAIRDLKALNKNPD